MNSEDKMNKIEIENRIKDFFSNRPEIIFAYLFGSFINKKHFHDVDAAVYLSKDFNKNDFKLFPYGYESFLLSELNILIRENIDIVVMNNAEILIQQRIINKGILLFSKDDRKRIHYENYIRKLYIDTESLRRIKSYYLEKHISNA